MECIIFTLIVILIYIFLIKSKENYQNYSVTGQPGSQYIEFCQTQCQSERAGYIWWIKQLFNKNKNDSFAECMLNCQNIIVNDPNQMVYLPTNANVYQNYGFTKSSP
jgi:hypothetical protein